MPKFVGRRLYARNKIGGAEGRLLSGHSEKIAYRSLSDYRLERMLAMITSRHRYLSRLATELQSELTLVIRSLYKG